MSRSDEETCDLVDRTETWLRKNKYDDEMYDMYQNNLFIMTGVTRQTMNQWRKRRMSPKRREKSVSFQMMVIIYLH